ncbi:response regulator transcription factor [Alkaliphilus peptidifermentans]|uniref:Stage 0 sporulation protein A homolog n=1 Tax=Alkaliphilus peptidifermentans DSM 18978 TaxID=1120976 RepID=A0A1G5FCU8_9FIRM|nr:helix-turn-helix domain-containing protein [Alkaliphilus peptidifermentans]SCY37092.1 two component transcriptional regulator, AraC family [Alkaliphilus peptidifermentans DSM 18978]
MIKLLIADDEHIVIESIKFIIDKYVDDVEIVGTAKSGRDAIEKSLLLKPDIVFMDIHMPGINGMDAIRHIKEANKDIIFVIISAYEYFQYAKDAVNLGVCEYLLKPINRNKVINTLRELTVTIKNKRLAIEREMALREKITRILPHMEGQFIYSQLFNSTRCDVRFYEDIFGMELKEGYVMVVSIDPSNTNNKEESMKNSLDRQQLFELFSLELKSSCSCLIGPPLFDRIVAYIPTNGSSDGYEIRNKAISYAQRITKRVNKSLNINYKIGLGRKYGIELFSESYNEACMAAVPLNEGQILHFEDINWTAPPKNTYPINKEKILIHNVLMGDLRGTLDTFEEIFLWLTLHYKTDKNYIKSKLIELFIMTQRILPNSPDVNIVDGNIHLMQILEFEEITELKISYIDFLKNTVMKLDEYRKKEMNGLIAKAVQYIEKNYKENISLDDVAKEINMSYHYFSKFFKDSTGKNFVDYLTELRIEKSKKILKDTSINIKEICFEVGYSDPNYFSKIFKKITGMTPTDYRNHALPQEVI